MMLLMLMLVPLVGAALVAGLPTALARTVSLVTTLAALFLTVLVFAQFDFAQASTQQFLASFNWFPQLGLTFSLGADSISMLLILLTALLGPICVSASWTAITENQKTFFAWLLVLQAAMVGVFAARDLILFYICFEFTLVPMYVLIKMFGSKEDRDAAAVKFFLYTFTGSIIALAGLVYVAVVHAQTTADGTLTFSISALAETARSLPLSVQAWLLLAMLAGFAVKIPLFPVHTWLPLAHTAAPTAGSVILAGVLLKLGTYAVYRLVLPFVPGAVIEYAPLLAVLCIIGIIYGGLICWVQSDVKKLVAYSSVAHLGFCMLGMFALNHTGLVGSILYMINHGLSTGALFLLIGMMYERYHTRDMNKLGGLGAKMPVWSTFMVFFAMASVGLPGLNGFVSEFLCMMGAFQASSAWGSGIWGSLGNRPVGVTPGNLGPWFAIIAGTGVIIAAMYLLMMVGRVVWGQLKEPAGHGHDHSHGPGHGHGHGAGHAHDAHALPADLTAREILTLAPLAILCLGLGVYPTPMIKSIEAPVRETVQLLDATRETMPALAPAPLSPTPSTTTPAAAPEGAN